MNPLNAFLRLIKMAVHKIVQLFQYENLQISNIMTDDLHQKFEAIRKKFIELNMLKDQINYISNQTGPHRHIVENSSLLWLARTTAIRLLVIDICKLLKREEANNISSLLGHLNSTYRKIEWKHPISQKRLHQSEVKISDIYKSEDFQKIKIARDRYIAHDDSKKSNYNSMIDLKMLFTMISEIEAEFNIVTYHLFDTTYIYPDTGNKKEIQNLYNYHCIRNLVADNMDNENHSKGFKAICKIFLPNIDLE